MAKVSTSDFRNGMVLNIDGELYSITEFQHVKPGKGGAFAQVEMKSLNRNTKLNERFRSNDTIEKASIENIEFNYLYDDEINYYFINQKNFEQVDVKKDIIGEKGKLLKENLNVDLIFHEDKAIGIELPNQVQFKIKSTDVALKGQTVSSSYKPAILENDIKIQVPPFIESGDEILVDTRTIEYIKKL